jgi:divalent metal cation (Fe/Co/Zn/Cd) transporter
VHNVSVFAVGGGTELSLHIKLPGDLSLDDAHEIAEEVERAIREAVPEIDAVQTHLEPLTEEGSGTRPGEQEVADDHDVVTRIVRETTGQEPAALRFLHTDDGLVAYLTLHLTRGTALADAHAQASRIEEQIRRERPDITDVLVHTEPS